jgi:hypothetical protein
MSALSENQSLTLKAPMSALVTKRDLNMRLTRSSFPQITHEASNPPKFTFPKYQ